MARRRLSDVLREEANKSSDDAITAAGAEQSTDEPEADVDAAGETAAIALDSVPPKTTTVAKSRATKTEATEPEATPAQKDEALLHQIADLTAALEAQKVTIEQLQTALEPLNALKTELEQSRKDVRQLTDSNDKLMQELKTLQPQETAIDTRTPTMQAASRSYKELRLSSPPIAATGNPPNSFNKDVGWFD